MTVALTVPNRMLGKLDYRHDARTLSLFKYLDPDDVPKAPASISYATAVKTWPMFLNDQLGDCTCAAMAHMIQAWTAAAGKEIDLADADVLAAYTAITGYDPKVPSSDAGAVELDVLKWWQKTGIAGHKIGAYAAVDIGSKELLTDALWLFGGLYIGVQLPLAAQSMGADWHAPSGGLSSPVNQPGGWGGHAVPVVGYDRYGLTAISWGETVRVSWGFWTDYVDEAWAVISTDFLNGKGTTPAGFNVDALNKDLKELGK